MVEMLSEQIELTNLDAHSRGSTIDAHSYSVSDPQSLISTPTLNIYMITDQPENIVSEVHTMTLTLLNDNVRIYVTLLR